MLCLVLGIIFQEGSTQFYSRFRGRQGPNIPRQAAVLGKMKTEEKASQKRYDVFNHIYGCHVKKNELFSVSPRQVGKH